MKLLIYGINFLPELTGIGKYSGEMGAWLAVRGYQVRVITAQPYYPDWQVHDGYSKYRCTFEETHGMKIVRCPLFVPKKLTILTRIVHLFSFALTSIPPLIRCSFWRPEVVICVVPTLFCAPGALLVGVLSRARTVIHVQDLEVDAMIGLKMSSVDWIGRLALAMEGWLLRRFDIVSSISSSMCDRIQKKLGAGSVVYEFPNWADTSFVAECADRGYFRREWGITLSTIVVLYSGNMGDKQGLDLIVDAAGALKNDDEVMFVVVGSGAAKDRLIAKAEATGSTNIRFYPLQPYERLPELVALADIHLVLQKRGAADLVMPSKLSTIFSAGGYALITADRDTELGRLCIENPGIAELCEPEDPNKLVESLKSMLKRAEVRSRTPNMIARNYAVERLERDKVLTAFADEVLAREI